MFSDFDKPTFDQKLKTAGNTFGKSNNKAGLTNPFNKPEKKANDQFK